MTDEMLMMRPRTRLDHRPAERLRDQKRALEICVQDGVPIRVAHAHQQAVARDAGVVDEHVHFAALGENFLGGGADGRGIRNIHRVRPRLAAQRADFRRDLLGIFLRARNDDDIRAFIGEFQRDGAADSAARAGDNGDLIGELAHKLSFQPQMKHRLNTDSKKQLSVFHL